MASAKILINFVSSTPINPRMKQECVKKDLGYYLDDYWRLSISKVPHKRTFAPFLIIERKKPSPTARIRFQLQLINLETKQEYSISDTGTFKKCIYFKLKYRQLYFTGCTLSIKGELEIQLMQSKEILPVPETSACDTKLSDDFKKLLCSRTFSDVVIQCGSQAFPAHKSILTARCPFFAEILLNTPNETQLDVNDLDPDVFKAVLFYIYSGKTKHMTFPDACDLLSAAKKYKLIELKLTCVDFIKQSFTLENVFDLFYKFEVAQPYASDFIAKNIKFIEYSEQWKIFKQEKPDIAAGLLALLPK